MTIARAVSGAEVQVTGNSGSVTAPTCDFVLAFIQGFDPDTPSDITSVTFDGSAMTYIDGHALPDGNTLKVYSAPGVSSGSKAFAVNWVTPTPNNGGPIQIFQFLTGTSVAVRASAKDLSGTAGPLDLAVTITGSLTGDFISGLVAGYSGGGASSNAAAGAGQTEDFQSSAIVDADAAIGTKTAGGNDTTWTGNHSYPSVIAVALYESGPVAFAPVSQTPADNATGVVLSATKSITFTEAAAAGTGNAYLKRTSDNATISTLAAASFSIAGAVVTFPFSVLPAYGDEVYVQVDSGAIVAADDAEAWAGISDTTSWSWTVRWGIEYIGGSSAPAYGSTTVTPGYPSGLASGMALLTALGQKPSSANGGTLTDPTSPACTRIAQITGATDGNTGGYSTTLGADTGNVNAYLLRENTVDGTETGTISISLGTSNAAWAFMLALDADGGTFDIAVTTGKRTSAATPATAVCAADPGFQRGDLFITIQADPTDIAGTWSAPTLTATGITTIGEQTVRAQPKDGTGNDQGGMVATGRILAGTSSGVPTVGASYSGTTTNATRGPWILVRVRRVAPGSTWTSAASGSASFVGAPRLSSAFSSAAALAASFTDTRQQALSWSTAPVLSASFAGTLNSLASYVANPALSAAFASQATVSASWSSSGSGSGSWSGMGQQPATFNSAGVLTAACASVSNTSADWASSAAAAASFANGGSTASAAWAASCSASAAWVGAPAQSCSVSVTCSLVAACSSTANTQAAWAAAAGSSVAWADALEGRTAVSVSGILTAAWQDQQSAQAVYDAAATLGSIWAPFQGVGSASWSAAAALSVAYHAQAAQSSTCTSSAASSMECSGIGASPTAFSSAPQSSVGWTDIMINAGAFASAATLIAELAATQSKPCEFAVLATCAAGYRFGQLYLAGPVEVEWEPREMMEIEWLAPRDAMAIKWLTR